MKLVLFFLLFSFQTMAFSKRVISTSPSVTNIIRELGAGDKLVAVSPYCENEKSLPITGTNFGFKFEKALSLRPDLIILPKTNSSKLISNFKKLNFHYLELDHDSVDGIRTSISILGKELGYESKAKLMLKTFDKKLMANYRESNKSVLIVVSSSLSHGKIRDLYSAGEESLYGDLIRKAGFKIATKGLKGGYPAINTEKLMALNPDVIFYFAKKENLDSYVKAWQKLSFLSAVKNKQVHALLDNKLNIPDHHIVDLVTVLREKVL
ncbi:ABC transporter substrate-binding protein [Halobacteriovorax sp. GB3]|uniref:ABC transporter substrate-binding protein n=1 Tax=Halobacteriovorax sp. GB3 TaxID=2719615 RepID=UPI00236165BE|nr:ABC transporter substrate-binding protein [Halobacteriovorax sp. GB3]MDD0852453.1 ABC transporter substrate-binding protein [Halobacteriovorax sp. GB3]